jgi:drug/metabolite transporter (DMT)-like permease
VPTRTLIGTGLAMAGFAANSLLTRGALGSGSIDAPSFTIIRLVTGALALAALLGVRSSPRRQAGSWRSAAWLAGYAVAFTLAYTRIGAGIGALLMFAAVQVTMIGAGIWRGDRPRASGWLGFGLSMVGLVWLTLPGAAAPDPAGVLVMIGAGVCWGAYSLAGRGSRDPLAATGGNFWRATLLGLVALGPLVRPEMLSLRGAALAAASGALASGLGYTLWYAVVPALGAWRAAIAQLTVPVLAGAGAVLVLGEHLTPRLAAAALLVTAGVLLSWRTPEPVTRNL